MECQPNWGSRWRRQEGNAVGAVRTNTAGSGNSEGRLYIFYMGGYGVLRTFSVIDEEEGNLGQSLSAGALFGSSVIDAGDSMGMASTIYG